MKILVLNGPNLNMLGIREPAIYGAATYDNLISMIKDHCEKKGIEVNCLQSNHEGDLVDMIQQSYQVVDGIVTNPGAYIESNLIGFYNILEACRHYPVEHLVYASSSSVYGTNKKVPYSTDDKVDNPVSLYAATKKSNCIFFLSILLYRFISILDTPAVIDKLSTT